MEKYNLDKLIKVSCEDFYRSRWFYYKKEKKLLGFVTIKEGVYSVVHDIYLGTEPPENCTIINYIIYENPEVTLYYQDNISKKYYFKSYNEAKNFVNEVTKSGNWKD